MSLYRLFLGSLATKGRVAAVALIGAVVMLLGAAAGAAAGVDRDDVAYVLVANLALTVLVPVTALVFASAALGDPVEDETLTYVWLAPVSRWKIVLAALAATVTIAAPLTVGPVVATTLLARVDADLVAASAAASGVAVAAYASVFVGLGLVVKRALAWGLAYVLIWEAVIAGIATGPARASVRHYALSVLADMTGREAGPFAVSATVGVVVPLCIAAAAVALTSLRLARQDVA